MGKAKPKTQRSKRSTSAPGPYLGFSTQTTRFLVRLLEAQEGDTVCLEIFADVGVEKLDGTKIAEESKSNLATNPLADRSVAFWKSIRNWVEAITNRDLVVATTYFHIFVTTATPGAIAQAFHDAGTIAEGRKALEKAKADLQWKKINFTDYAEELRPHLKIVFSADPDLVAELIAHFQILSGLGNAHDRVRQLMLRELVSEDACNDVVNWAHGWVKERVDQLLNAKQLVRIKWLEFHNALLNYVRVNDRATMLRSIAGTPTAEDIQTEMSLRVYVRQAKLIQLDDDMILEAINDFLAASIDRTSWADDGYISEAGVETYSKDLTSSWRHKRGSILVGHKEKSDQDKGKILYHDCMQITVALQGLATPAHFSRGSLHALADDLLIGWHPAYETELKSAKRQNRILSIEFAMPISTLARETALVQNPALGGVLLWRFCVSYAAEHRTNEGPPLQLAFLVLPMTLHRGTFEELSGTRSSIHQFAEKFAKSDTSKSDMLLGIQDRAIEFRDLTIESVSLALRTRLVTLVSNTGRLVALSTSKSSALPQSVRPLATGAERIGKWFSTMTLYEIENVLKVAF